MTGIYNEGQLCAQIRSMLALCPSPTAHEHNPFLCILRCLIETMSIQIATLVSIIIRTYFNQLWCIYNFSDLCLTLDNNPMIKMSLNHVLASDFFETIKCEAFVITSDDPERDIELIEDKLRINRNYSFNIRYYLFVYTGPLNDSLIATNFFTKQVLETVVNILVLVEDDHCVYFYTHYFKGAFPLQTNIIGKVCNSTDITILDLYPNKQHDSMGRNLTVGTFNFVPYVHLEKGRGAELSVVNCFASKYNYTINLQINDDLWGKVYDNMTGVGTKFDLFLRTVDIGVGGFFISELNYKLDHSTFLHRTGLSFLVPRPKIDNGLTTLLKPFEVHVWIIVITILVTLVIVMYIVNALNVNSKSSYKGTQSELYFEFAFLILGILLQQPRKLRSKLFSCSLIQFGIILLVSFYNSGYSSIMTKPSYLRHIATANQLEKSGIPKYALDDSYLNCVDKLDFPKIKYETMMVDTPSLKNTLTRTTEVAIAIDHLNLGYTFGDFSDAINISTLEKFTVIRDDVSFDWCVFPIYKHSAILPPLDTFLLRIRQAGLDQYYLAEAFRDLDYEKTTYTSHIFYMHSDVNHYFNITTLSGAFFMLFLGLLVSSILFLWEIKNSIRNKHRWVHHVGTKDLRPYIN